MTFVSTRSQPASASVKRGPSPRKKTTPDDSAPLRDDPRAAPERPSIFTRVGAQFLYDPPLPLIAAVAGLIALLLAGGLIWSLIRISDQDSTNSLRSSALAAAQKYGVYLTSYDYHDLSSPTAAWSEVDAHSTTTFRGDFDKTKSTVSQLVVAYQATANGKVIDAAVQSLSGSQAVVLLFVDQSTTKRVQSSKPTTQLFRVQLVMARQHGKWLIDELNVPS